MFAGNLLASGLLAPAAALVTPPGPDWGSLGISQWAAGWYGVGGEVGMPASTSAVAGTRGEFDLPACKIISWIGNVGCWVTGYWEALFGLTLGLNGYPVILKADGSTHQVGLNWPVYFPDINLDWPGGTISLTLGVIADHTSNFEMQTILRTAPL
jgi:hypothetical protein